MSSARPAIPLAQVAQAVGARAGFALAGAALLLDAVPLGREFLTGQLKPEKLHASDFRKSDPRLQGESLAANLRIVDAIGRVVAAGIQAGSNTCPLLTSCQSP